MTGAMEGGRRDDQDRRIDEQREAQGEGRIDERVLDRHPLPRRCLLVRPGLYHRRMQVQVVRHHRRAEDPDRDVQLIGVGQDGGAGHEAARDRAQVGTRDEDLEHVAGAGRSQSGWKATGVIRFSNTFN